MDSTPKNVVEGFRNNVTVRPDAPAMFEQAGGAYVPTSCRQM